MAGFDIKTMQARFHQLIAERDAIRAKSAPLRKQRDEIEAKARTECAKIDANVLEVETSLRGVKDELARIARALDGKTGTPPTKE